MAGYEKMVTELDKLHIMFKHRHSPLLASGADNPRYIASIGIYTNGLQGFSDWEFEDGIRRCLEGWKGPFWPTCEELRGFMLQAQHERQYQERKHNKPETLPPPQEEEIFTPEHKQKMADRFARIQKAMRPGFRHANGRRYGEDYEADHRFVYGHPPKEREQL